MLGEFVESMTNVATYTRAEAVMKIKNAGDIGLDEFMVQGETREISGHRRL